MKQNLTKYAGNTNSYNNNQEFLQKLKALAPGAVTADGKLNVSALKAILGESEANDDINEKFGLNWAGKHKIYGQIRQATTDTLKPNRQNSVDFNKTQNMFIEGDNLSALKILERSYFNKVKMIYIDPPYNTGNDFVYNDDFKTAQAEHEQQAGTHNDQGKVKRADGLTKNSKDKGRYHSHWLNMMYPRLHIARNLLKDDGVIFVSIDDNEVHHLRLIMDEIFGEENFIAQFIWHKKNVVQNDARFVSTNHEYVLCFSKNSDTFLFKPKPRDEVQLSRFKNHDNDPRGPWTSVALQAKSGTKTYSVVFDNGISWEPAPGTYPRLTKEKLLIYYKDNRIWFGKNNTNVPRLKKFLSEVAEGTISNTLLKVDDVGSTQLSKERLKKIFNGQNLFDTPKPIDLIKYIMMISSDGNDIILDFFAGSGTTAHAVMEQNAKDGGNRKFILVQLPETTDETSEAYKAGYKTIADIARERIRRAGQKVLKDNADKLKDRATPLDIGFKDFAVSPSNFKDIPNGANSQAELLLVDNLKSNATDQDLLTQLRLLQGQTINNQPKTLTFGDLTVYVQGSICYCLQANANIDDLTALLKAGFTKIVLLDRCFKNDQDSTNFEQQYLALDSSINLETY